MRKLQSLGLLDKLDLLTCVSGGSIAGAFVAANWSTPDKLDRLDTYLRTRSIAVSSVIGGIFDPFETRLDKLAALVRPRPVPRRDAEGSRGRAARLPQRDAISRPGTCSSSWPAVACPRRWASTNSAWCPRPDFKVSRAVAASSAFPPVFPPLRLDADIYAHASTVEYVTLTDGGVYDNMGINPVVRVERNALDYVIVSDGGKPFAIDERPTDSGAIVLKASLGHHDGADPRTGVRSPAASVPGKARSASRCGSRSTARRAKCSPAMRRSRRRSRTNLQRLSDDEMKVLTRHGGGLVESRLRRYAPELRGT